ncbi:MAG: extracellular solute-binding protein [Anaerolineae bacterium]|nr:extracellular solute-binding protein [Anaerolineae bacterium]
MDDPVACLCAFGRVFCCPPGRPQAQRRVLNIYSARHYGAIEAPFTQFEADTGIEIRLSQGSERDLLERLRAEGDRTPADLFLAIDAGVLALAAEEGLLQPVESETLAANIAPEFRDPEKHWYGLSIRARTAVYNPEAVSEEELAQLNSYADLANPIWEGRLCMRPASHIYTVSLFSSLIYHLAEEEARSVLEGIVANDPTYINSDTPHDRSRWQRASATSPWSTTTNLGRLINDEAEVADEVELKWLNQETTGAFFNVNGAGITANAENFDEALEFIEYFSTVEGQAGTAEGFPGSNFEFPTNPEAEPIESISGFGDFMLDTEYPLWEYGSLQAEAVRLLEETGFGFGES